MPSRLQDAQDQFEGGLSYMQKLIDNKDKIINGLEELSEGVRGHRTLFDWRVKNIYEYLEDDFLPSIGDIKNQIDLGKLSKRKYKIIVEDTQARTQQETFHTLLAPIQKLVFGGGENVSMARVMKENKNAHFGFNKLYDWLDMGSDCILPIEQIIRYGSDKEDSNYYYFEWYDKEEEYVQAKVEKIDKRTIKKSATIDKLEYTIDKENFSLKLYIKGKEGVYQNISFIELDFLTIGNKPNKRCTIFNKLVKGLDVFTNAATRQQVRQINDTFKEILKLDNKIIEPKGGKYKLQITKKEASERVTTDDVLSHHGRYVQIPANSESMLNFASEEMIDNQDENIESEDIISLDEFADEEHLEGDDWQKRAEDCE